MHDKLSGTWSPGLSATEQQTLFAITRDTLRWCANDGTAKFRMEDYQLTEKLQTVTATFITLKIQGDLRGCIGSLEAIEPLYLSVHGNTVNAAMHDPRFAPVQPDELPGISISISVLSPLTAIAGPDDFQLGRHGIILSKAGHRAVFLPEVAVEQGWDRDETLTYLSQKAGLSPDAWRQGAKFQVFESAVLKQ